MIDDNTLVQVFATVLVGILIFLTLQRHFVWQERFEIKGAELRGKRTKARQRIIDS